MSILQRVSDHAGELRKVLPENDFICVSLQGSQNYNLDTEYSDVDTKAIIIPSFDDIVKGKNPYSSTHIRDNDEHIDIKDVRLAFKLFRKQNPSYVEILFTDYQIVNPEYEQEWDILVEERETIARYSPYLMVKAIKGMAYQKYHAMTHEYPSKTELIKNYGYDGKQVSHLIRLYYLLDDYINGVPFSAALDVKNKDFLIDLKMNKIPLHPARELAEKTLAEIEKLADNFCDTHELTCDERVDTLLNDIQYEIIKKSLRKELI